MYHLKHMLFITHVFSLTHKYHFVYFYYNLHNIKCPICILHYNDRKWQTFHFLYEQKTGSFGCIFYKCYFFHLCLMHFLHKTIFRIHFPAHQYPRQRKSAPYNRTDPVLAALPFRMSGSWKPLPERSSETASDFHLRPPAAWQFY